MRDGQNVVEAMADLDCDYPGVHHALVELRRPLPLDTGALDSVLRSPVGAVGCAWQRGSFRPVWFFSCASLTAIVPKKSLGYYAPDGGYAFHLGRICPGLQPRSDCLDDGHWQRSARRDFWLNAVEEFIVT